MYKSLKKWMTVPIALYPLASKASTGNKTFSSPVSILCYLEHKHVRVTNRTGVEVDSSISLYIDGSQAINELDEVTVLGSRRPVKAVTIFYTGAGVPDVKVVSV